MFFLIQARVRLESHKKSGIHGFRRKLTRMQSSRVLHKSFDLKRWLLERKGGREGEKTAVWKLDEDFSFSTLELYFILGNHRCAGRLSFEGRAVSKKTPV